MIICKVKKRVVSSHKLEVFDGSKLLLVQPVDPKTGKDKGEAFLALDSVQAGPDDLVLASREGNTCRQIFGDNSAPIHGIILGIIDDIKIGQ
jgi:microcompartment protein CcmK/EutM